MSRGNRVIIFFLFCVERRCIRRSIFCFGRIRCIMSMATMFDDEFLGEMTESPEAHAPQFLQEPEPAVSYVCVSSASPSEDDESPSNPTAPAEGMAIEAPQPAITASTASEPPPVTSDAVPATDARAPMAAPLPLARDDAPMLPDSPPLTIDIAAAELAAFSQTLGRAEPPPPPPMPPMPAAASQATRPPLEFQRAGSRRLGRNTHGVSTNIISRIADFYRNVELKLFIARTQGVSAYTFDKLKPTVNTFHVPTDEVVSFGSVQSYIRSRIYEEFAPGMPVPPVESFNETLLGSVKNSKKYLGDPDIMVERILQGRPVEPMRPQRPRIVHTAQDQVKQVPHSSPPRAAAAPPANRGSACSRLARAAVSSGMALKAMIAEINPDTPQDRVYLHGLRAKLDEIEHLTLGYNCSPPVRPF